MKKIIMTICLGAVLLTAYGKGIVYPMSMDIGFGDVITPYIEN